MIRLECILRYLMIIILMGNLSIFFSNCSTIKIHNDYKFRKNQFVLQQPTLLRTDGVYVKAFNKQNVNIYSFIRFYKNGRCFVSNSFNGMMNLDTLSSTYNVIGERTYFRNYGDNITYEEWGGNYAGHTFVYGLVNVSSLVITSYRPRGIITTIKKLPEQQVYQFKPLSLTEVADW